VPPVVFLCHKLRTMTSKHWALVGGAVACLSVALHSAALQAAPWMEPGDIRARHAVQKLADRGHLDRPVSDWPVTWSAIHNGVDSTTTATDAPATASQRAYLAFEKEQQAENGFRGEVAVSGTTEETAIRGFGNHQPADGSISADFQWQGKSWALGLSPTAVINPEDDEEFRADGSYFAATAGNWVFGAGAIDRWWGPGWQSSLILSDNARPVPAIWINRKDTAAPESDWLSWIGPWQFTLTAGQFMDDRVVDDTKLVGMRFSMRPITGLEIGLSRIFMFGGEGRPESASTLWDMFIGRDNSQDGSDKDPGNQLGAIDIRYGFGLGDQTLGLYTQMMGEDEAGAFPARKSWLFGFDWTTQLANQDQQWFVEYTNTLADDFLGDAMPNITYDHFRYQTGYQHHGRVMAASFDGDASAVTFGVFHFMDNGDNLSMKLTHAELNKDGGNRSTSIEPDVFNYVPDGDQTVAIADLGYGTRLFKGWLDLNLQLTDNKLRLLSGEKNRWSLGATWRYRF